MVDLLSVLILLIIEKLFQAVELEIGITKIHLYTSLISKKNDKITIILIVVTGYNNKNNNNI